MGDSIIRLFTTAATAASVSVIAVDVVVGVDVVSGVVGVDVAGGVCETSRMRSLILANKFRTRSIDKKLFLFFLLFPKNGNETKRNKNEAFLASNDNFL